MDNIKLGDLYLSKIELDDIVQVVAKKETYKGLSKQIEQ